MKKYMNIDFNFDEDQFDNNLNLIDKSREDDDSKTSQNSFENKLDTKIDSEL